MTIKILNLQTFFAPRLAALKALKITQGIFRPDPLSEKGLIAIDTINFHVMFITARQQFTDKTDSK
tara:strand:- start:41828 stop:42025 length:198 start_codon:yes stop_codon:yes gene_type:complete